MSQQSPVAGPQGGPYAHGPQGGQYGPGGGQGHAPGYAQGGYSTGPQMGPTGPSVPGPVIGTGAMAMAVGIMFFLLAAMSLLALAKASSDYGGSGSAVSVAWVTVILMVSGSVLLVLGAFQLLSGSNRGMVILGGLLSMVSVLVALVWVLSQGVGSEAVWVVLGAVIVLIFPAVVVITAMGRTAGQWLHMARGAWR